MVPLLPGGLWPSLPLSEARAADGRATTRARAAALLLNASRGRRRDTRTSEGGPAGRRVRREVSPDAQRVKPEERCVTKKCDLFHTKVPRKPDTRAQNSRRPSGRERFVRRRPAAE